jgi:hypothetical protein
MPGWGRPLSVREGGRSWRKLRALVGGLRALIAGSDRFCLRSCALVVVGSLRSDGVDVLAVGSLLLPGVEGDHGEEDEGVVGVGILVTEDCAE